MPKKPAKGQPALVPKVMLLKRKLDSLPESCQQLIQTLWNARDGWRDEQRNLILAAIEEAIRATHTAVAGEMEKLLDERRGMGDTLIPIEVLSQRLDRIEPFEADTLPDSLHGKLMRQRIEEAVDGVDDDIESFADYLADPDLCPKAEDQPPEEHLAIGFAEASHAHITSELTQLANDMRALDAEEFWRDVIHALTPQQRCIIAAILAAS